MNWFKYKLKKYSLFRLAIFLVFIFALALILKFVSNIMISVPVVEQLFPSVVHENDVVTITGKNFSKPDETNGIYFGTEFFPSINCALWTDNKITFTVPKNFKTSLISVSVAKRTSKKSVLTNKDDLPIVLHKTILTSMPEIISLSRENGVVGQSVTIYGKNFGGTRHNSDVIFTELTENFLAGNPKEIKGAFCNEADFDFVNWNDNEITVHVPDTAVSGNIVVRTDAGFSNAVPFTVSAKAGKKKLSNKRNIVIALTTSVADFSLRSKQNTLFLSVPQPIESYMQKNVYLKETNSHIFATKFQGGNIYRFENLTEKSNIEISEVLSVETSDVFVKVNPDNIPATLKLKPEILRYTNAEDEIPSENKDIKAKANEIADGSSNPYNKAKRVFDYLVKNTVPTAWRVNHKTNLSACLTTGLADAYEISLLYCTLLRALQVPCIQVHGMVIGKEQSAYIHWWNEFYLEGLGWVPVDTALALGMPYKTEKTPSEFFAQLDGLHISFSRSVQHQTKMLSDSAIVTKTKSYAKRQIWEENTGLAGYNSFWGVPKVIAIY